MRDAKTARFHGTAVSGSWPQPRAKWFNQLRQESTATKNRLISSTSTAESAARATAEPAAERAQNKSLATPELHFRTDASTRLSHVRRGNNGLIPVESCCTHLIGGRGCVVAHVVQPRVPRGGDRAAVVVVDVGVLHPSVLAWN